MARNGYPENFSELFRQIIDAGNSMVDTGENYANDFLTSPDPNQPQILDRLANSANNGLDYLGIPDLPGMPRARDASGQNIGLEAQAQPSAAELMQAAASPSTFSAVEPGTSESEKAKNLAIHAANLQKIAQRNADIINSRLAELKGKSSPDTLSFVAKGDRMGGDLSSNSKGSYSKTPTQDENSRSQAERIKQGFSPELASAIESVANAKNGNEARAAELGLQFLPEKLNPQQQDLAFIDKLSQSKNPAALNLLKVYFRRKGYSEEQINSLMGKNS